MDPNKYAKNRNIQAESKFSTIRSIIFFGLIILGIIGISMEFFREDGILKTLLSQLFESTTSMLLIPVIAGVIWWFNRWTTNPNKNETKKAGNVPMYIMMAIGVFFLVRIIMTGGF
jgi:membrane protein insertase Oxa1/YidC/SpoIIIJ